MGMSENGLGKLGGVKGSKFVFDRLASLGSSNRTAAKKNELSGLVHSVAQTEGIREIERGSMRIDEVEGKIPRELV